MRVIGGWFPILILAVIVYGLLVYVWLSSPDSPVIAGLLAAWTASAVAAAGWLAHSLRRRTPTSIELSASEVAAIWSGTPSRRELVQFRQVRSINPRHWRWISAPKLAIMRSRLPQYSTSEVWKTEWTSGAFTA